MSERVWDSEEWIEWAHLTSPIREAVYMGDRGQPCVAIGIELNQEYCEIAAGRLSQLSLLAEPGA